MSVYNHFSICGNAIELKPFAVKMFDLTKHFSLCSSFPNSKTGFPINATTCKYKAVRLSRNPDKTLNVLHTL